MCMSCLIRPRWNVYWVTGVTESACLISFNCTLIVTLTCKISSQSYDLESGPSAINRKNRMVPHMRKKTNINGTNINFLSAFWACTTVLWVKTPLLWWSWGETLGLLMCLIHYAQIYKCFEPYIHLYGPKYTLESWFFESSRKTKLVWKITQLEKSGIKLQCSTGEGNNCWFEFSGGSKNQVFEKSGLNRNYLLAFSLISNSFNLQPGLLSQPSVTVSHNFNFQLPRCRK